MASTGDILGTGVSALLAYQRALSTTGHNIANVNTEGFSRQRVELDARVPQQAGNGFIGKGVSITSVQRLHSEFLTGQVRASASTLGQLDSYNGLSAELDNLLADSRAGLAPALQGFFGAMDDLADDPASGPVRQVLLSQASALATRFAYLDQRLADINSAINQQLRVSVTDINSLAGAIARVNNDIVRASAGAGGQPPNDLLDRRDDLLQQLAERVGVSTVSQDNGAVNVFIGNGQALVVGDQARSLTTAVNSFDPTRLEIQFAAPASSGPISRFLTGGSVGGALAFRGEVLDSARHTLGQLAQGLAATVNAQHRLGQDLDGDLGGDFFSIDAPQVVAAANNTGSPAAQIDAVISDVAALVPSDYRLNRNGGSYTLTRLSDGTITNLATFPGGAETVDGVTLSLASGTIADGDSFLIRPVHGAASTLGVAITNTSDVAAAAPIRSSADLANTGSGAISAGTVNGPPPVDANLRETVTITFNDPPTSFDVSGTGTGNPTGVAFTAGGDISYNGWTVRISGIPAAGDSFVVSRNINGVGDNRNALLLGGLQEAYTLNGDTVSLGQVYGQLVADVGSRSRESALNRDAQQSLHRLAVDSRDSLSAVNLDEEAANLLRFQQAYQAAAQVISSADFMFQELIQVTRR